jgi:putative phage-type endonuclease
MNPNFNDINNYINQYNYQLNKDNIDEFLDQIINELTEIYDSDNETIKQANIYIIQKFVNQIIDNKLFYIQRKEKFIELTKLKLPPQRSQEWYELRREKLTASSLADAIGKGHFKTRDECLLDKIEPSEYKMHPITEWGVKYEDVAIEYYEYLTKSKIRDFGLIPHPTLPIFAASPDGICDDSSPGEYIGRMLEIKCPPKRVFSNKTKIPEHYEMQMQGQLECCDLDECDFLQVKFEEYSSFYDYKNDANDEKQNGLTNHNYPKGCVITYQKINDKTYHYLYCPLLSSIEDTETWITNKKELLNQNNHQLFEIKYWKILHYKIDLVKRNKEWWNNNIIHILDFYKDLIYYKNNINELKSRIQNKITNLPDFALCSDEEN